MKEGIRQTFIITVIIFFIFSCIALLVFYIYLNIFLPVKVSSLDKTPFLVRRGESLSQIAGQLEEKNFIRSKKLFIVYALFKKKGRDIKAGEYILSRSMSVPQILNRLVEGKVESKKLTIIEGWDLKNIAWTLEGMGLCQAEEFFDVVGYPAVNYAESKNQKLPRPVDFSKDFPFLKEKPKDVSLEGFIFPDTYQVSGNFKVEDFVRQALENFDKKTKNLRQVAEEKGMNFYNVLTMASLLEKEASTYNDRQIIAGILWKRLKNNWFLQVDTTLTYLTGKKSLELSRRDFKIDSLYNTYKYKGLPLGPICNPSLESIKAAIYYKDSPYWYYLTKPNGEVVFSKTLKEHNINKYKYLK